MTMNINPDPKEISAACKPLLSSRDSSPFARACKAIKTPERAANKSKRIKKS
jgi:hypothetical protein